jgi:hypothetical protein
MLVGMTDDPNQFRGEQPLTGIFRHAQRELERSRRGDGGMNYDTVPF